MSKDIIRRCIFRPYRKGMGPVFALTVWDTHKVDSRGCSYLGYSLRLNGVELFTGEDFAHSPLAAVDSDETINALMSFLVLRPGDTDVEYFAHYTQAQHEFCEQHAEALSGELLNRFADCYR